MLSKAKSAQCFRFVRVDYQSATGIAELVYAFDDGPELIETLCFPNAPVVTEATRAALDRALASLHWIAGISYYKAAVVPAIRVDGGGLNAATAAFLDELYLHGLGEFAHQNGLDLRGRIRFPVTVEGRAAPLVSGARQHSRQTLVPIGGGKDSLVSVELMRQCSEPMTAVWVGNSALIAATAARTGLPTLNIQRVISPLLFELNRQGAYNGHIPVTAINSAILVVAAVLYGFDAIAFSNERSASSANLHQDGFAINHQWSKGFRFEQLFRQHIQTQITPDLDYFSVLRCHSELAVTQKFAQLVQYHEVFSSCNRNFRILGERPTARWCGVCPKCHFVFLALAPFLPKARLLAIFGRNLLDDAALVGAFDALLEIDAHKPFECVGEGIESRAALAALAARAEWCEDAVVARFRRDILPGLDSTAINLQTLLQPSGDHFLPPRLASIAHAH
ncbi:MAG: hypothetical protein COS34_13395 [Lysobacterales bacterium CG02_land_8_20_14_3_00_62_12]|nr:MAG: hypothetical protein COS34_13395 [Xanthomonadales bacterium CG02_land_8_20_14_3_00_62_12]